MLGLLLNGASLSAREMDPQTPSQIRSKSSRHPKTKTTKATNAPQAEQQGGEQSPLAVKILPSQDAEAKAAKEEQQREEKAIQDKRVADATVWLAGVTTALAIFTGGLWYATYRLAQDARRTADRQATETQKSIGIAKQSADAAVATAKSYIKSERAFVKISHFPPGIIFFSARRSAVQVKVENFGRTPARVTDVVLTFKAYPNTSDLPTEPDYTGARPVLSQAFLVTGDWFKIPRNTPFDEADNNEFKNGGQRLVVLGYVDYIDQFGQRHRAGYGREYRSYLDLPETYGTEILPKDRSNLELIPQRQYNYDRERQPREGNDWGTT